jgi:pyridoxine kinase
MGKMFNDFGTKDTLLFVDPCMADNGTLYPGFTPEFAAAMAKLAGKADVIVPNLTEASYLLGIPYRADGYDESYIREILVKLAGLGARKVVVKGVSFEKGKLGIMAYDAATKKFSTYFHEKISQSFHGTGDIFASVCVGALMRGMSLENSLKLAADFVVQSIKQTIAHEDHNWYGVDFESVFPFLLERLKKEAVR